MSKPELKLLMELYRAPGALCAATDDHESADFEREYSRMQSELCEAERQTLPDLFNANDGARALFYSYAFSGVRAGRDEDIADVARRVERVLDTK